MTVTPVDASTHHRKNSHKCRSDGVVPELVTLIKPGLEQGMRAAPQLHVAAGAATVHGMFQSAMAGAIQP